MLEFQGIHAPSRPVRHAHPVSDRRPADRPLELRRTHVGEEPRVDAHHRQQALVAGVGERQDRFGSVGVDHRMQSLGDLGERVVPAHQLERS
jgi:hypothetical protein